MLRCNRCGQYYIPGFLDCQCRTTSHRPNSNTGLYPSLSANRAATTLPLGTTKATRVMDSVDTSKSPVPMAVGSGSNSQRISPQREKE